MEESLQGSRRKRNLWEEEEIIPDEFEVVSFCGDDLLYLKEYLSQRGFDKHFIRSVLHDTLRNLWENRGYSAYFLLSVTCYFLFGFNANPLDLEYIEGGWEEGSYINGEEVDVDLSEQPNEEIIDLLDGVSEMESSLRDWIEQL